ncbi:hypothetical protein DFH09DRAFT_1109971 [Mycena vulgaris]|nr:hypothetical protein DFH09DRAFT_1109971 [Mycena vulgaris]
MSFFPNSSGINILGGTFYSATGDVNIQNNHQLAIATSGFNLASGEASSSNLPIGWEEYPEEWPLAGPVRKTRPGARWLGTYASILMCRLPTLTPTDNTTRRSHLSGQSANQGPSFLSEHPAHRANSNSWSESGNSHIDWDSYREPPLPSESAYGASTHTTRSYRSRLLLPSCNLSPRRVLPKFGLIPGRPVQPVKRAGTGTRSTGQPIPHPSRLGLGVKLRTGGSRAVRPARRPVKNGDRLKPYAAATSKDDGHSRRRRSSHQRPSFHLS